MTTTPEFQEAYASFHTPISRYLAKMVGPHEADDLAQEVFAKVDRALPGFKGESKLSTWIYRIATNTALDRLKSPAARHDGPKLFSLDDLTKKEEHCGTAAPGKQPDQKVIQEEMNACIREFVDRLPTNYKTVLVLAELKELSNREIADILEISLASVKIRLHRARALLKKELEQGCDFYRDERNELCCDRKQPRKK